VHVKYPRKYKIHPHIPHYPLKIPPQAAKPGAPLAVPSMLTLIKQLQERAKKLA